jgi:hypothetical protein
LVECANAVLQAVMALVLRERAMVREPVLKPQALKHLQERETETS